MEYNKRKEKTERTDVKNKINLQINDEFYKVIVFTKVTENQPEVNV